MDQICRACSHFRSEKEYRSYGEKVVHIEPGNWCAGSYSPVSGQRELIPCEVNRAAYGNCRASGDLYEPKVQTETVEMNEPCTLKAPAAESESHCETEPLVESESNKWIAPKSTNEPIMQTETGGVSESSISRAPEPTNEPSNLRAPGAGSESHDRREPNLLNESCSMNVSNKMNDPLAASAPDNQRDLFG
jgi:hypothetical protein